MNNVPNSDSEQCTESKLGWVHQVHTLTQAARTAPRPCAQRRVAGLAWPCRRPGPAVSWPLLGRVAGIGDRVTGPLWVVSPLFRARPYARCAAHIAAPFAVSQRCCVLHRDTTQQPSCLRSRYNLLYHDTVPQPGPAHTRCRPCRGLPWPCRGRG